MARRVKAGMSESIWTSLVIINECIDELQATMTEGSLEAVAERYRTWKSATRSALEGLAVDSVLRRFDLAQAPAVHGDGRRPTPGVYLDGAASRAFLMALRRELEKDPAGVLRLPPARPMSATPPLAIRKLIDLLERRLPKAFRGRPEKEGDLHDGFETLLAGALMPYQRESGSIVPSARTCAPDFTFPGLEVVVELKLCDRSERESEIITEINDEIPAYRARYPHVIFGVFDQGFIQNRSQFVEAFEGTDGVWVRVIRQRP